MADMLRLTVIATTDEEQFLASGASPDGAWRVTRRFDIASWDLTRMSSGRMPVLESHEAWTLERRIGSVVAGSARVDGGQLMCEVDIDPALASERTFSALESGAMRNWSIGALPWRPVVSEQDTHTRVVISDGEPVELSVVNAGACRGAETIMKTKSQATAAAAGTPGQVMRADLPTGGAAGAKPDAPETAVTVPLAQGAPNISITVNGDGTKPETAGAPKADAKPETAAAPKADTAAGGKQDAVEDKENDKMDAAAVAAQAQTAERERVMALQDFGRAYSVDVSAAISDGTSIADFRRAQHTAGVSRQDGMPASLASAANTPGQSEPERLIRAMSDGILIRQFGADLAAAGLGEHPGGDKAGDGGGFAGLTARELMYSLAQQSGTPMPYGNDGLQRAIEIASARGFGSGLDWQQQYLQAGSGYQGMQGLGMFGNLLQQTGDRVLVSGFNGVDPRLIHWREWCQVQSATDFRARDYKIRSARERLGAKRDGGVLPHSPLSDAVEASITTEIRGNRYSVSFETIVNDSLGGIFADIQDEGWNAAESVQYDAMQMLLANSGLGVTFGGSNLFTNARNNISSPAAAISAAALIADAGVMVAQTAQGSNRPLARRPDVLLVPYDQGFTASALNGSEYERRMMVSMELVSNTELPVSVSLFRKVIGTEYITGNRRYLISGNGRGMGGGAMGLPGSPLVVQFFNGMQNPRMIRTSGGPTLGIEYECWLPYKVAPISHLGLVTNAGA